MSVLEGDLVGIGARRLGSGFLVVGRGCWVAWCVCVVFTAFGDGDCFLERPLGIRNSLRMAGKECESNYSVLGLAACVKERLLSGVLFAILYLAEGLTENKCLGKEGPSDGAGRSWHI